MKARMDSLLETLRQYGNEETLSPDTVVFRQGAESDGVCYVVSGRLAAYREEGEACYLLSETTAGGLVGEIGATIGWARTATIKAEEESRVIWVTGDDFRRALVDVPGLAQEIVRMMSERLTAADAARVDLGRSYDSAVARVQSLRTEMARLEELLALREELANTIVHDLRNPIGVIAVGLEMIRRAMTGEDDRARTESVIDLVSRSVQRLQGLVDMLLDIARLEKGDVELQIVPVDLHTMVNEVLSDERLLAEGAHVSLDNEVDPHLAPIPADRPLLQRVLVNLVDNALKFTPPAGRVWITAGVQQNEARVEVIDTGPGIPPDERVRIFEKFTQVKGRIGARRGSGLGLAFCRMAIETHGGRIWVEDGPGSVGSCFVLTLPVAQ